MAAPATSVATEHLTDACGSGAPEAICVRVGIPHAGGELVRAAGSAGHRVLFSANAFARKYGKGHRLHGEFRSFRRPDIALFDGLDAALDSAGFVAAARYGDFLWSVSDYYDLVQSYPWAWVAAMDYCCEPEIAADRPMRLLRMAGTAFMLARCQNEARRRDLADPMPILQGWTPEEYALCADWLPLDEWPNLVGIGSVCRRHAHGSDGVLAIVESLDALLPAHVRFHLFGVKSSVLEHLVGHRRLASVDSMAWDFQARVARRTGRDMAFRAEQMHRWAARQNDRVEQQLRRHATRENDPVQGLLFDANHLIGAGASFRADEETILEALALQYADLVMDGDIGYRDAVHLSRVDACDALAIVRNRGITPETMADFDEMLAGFGERAAQMLGETTG